MKNKVLLLAGIAFSFLLSSCGDNKKNDPNFIKVGVISGPEYVIAQEAQKIAKEKYGLNVKLVQFNDYVMPNTALNEKDIDINAFQTKPFMDDQINQRGYKLAIVGNTFIYPMAGYSKKIKNLSDLQEGSTIAIPNDAANLGRALILLQKNNLIELKNTNTLTPKTTDIIKNPKNLKIVELEGPQLPRALDDDKVALAIINNTFVAQTGKSLKDALFVEDKDSPYVNLIVSREDNKDEEKVKKFVQAYQTDEVAKVADVQFKGGAVKGW